MESRTTAPWLCPAEVRGIHQWCEQREGGTRSRPQMQWRVTEELDFELHLHNRQALTLNTHAGRTRQRGSPQQGLEVTVRL